MSCKRSFCLWFIFTLIHLYIHLNYSVPKTKSEHASQSLLLILLKDELLKAQSDKDTYYKLIKPLFKGVIPDLAEDSFSWAYSILISRQNNILHKLKDESGERSSSNRNSKNESIIQILALIPVYDMFNHAFITTNQVGIIPHNMTDLVICYQATSFYDPEEEASQLYSAQNVDEGSEVFMTYGKRSNQKLFLYQGFVGPLSCYDRILVVCPGLVKSTKHV